MIALIQRVSQASVKIQQQSIAEIDAGIVLLLGVEKTDSTENADKLLDKVLNYRIFSDVNQRMNLSLIDTGLQLLVVSQFTLVADTQKGTRPRFSKGAPPEQAEQLYEYFVKRAKARVKTKTGQFAADMQVSLTNDGPVTFWIQT